MKWKLAACVFTVAIMMSADARGSHLGKNGRPASIELVCLLDGPCGQGKSLVAIGPVCDPNGPCGNGKNV